MKTKKRPWGIALVGLAGVFCCGGGLLLAVGASFVKGRAETLPTESERARKLGLLTSLAETAVRVPPERDARPIVSRALSEWRKVSVPDRRRQIRDAVEVLSFASPPPIRKSYAASAIERRRILEPLRQAGRFTEMSVIPDSSPADPDISAVLWVGVNFFAANAVMAAEAQDPETAIREIDAGRRLLPLLDACPNASFLFERCWAEIRLHRAMARVVRLHPTFPSLRVALTRLLNETGPPLNPRRAMGAELAYVVDRMKRKEAENMPPIPFAESFFMMGRAELIRIFADHVGKMPTDADDPKAVGKALAEMRKAAAESPLLGGSFNYSWIEYTLKDRQTRRRLAATGLAVMNGHSPKALKDLGPLAIDPHSGKPFRTYRIANATVIYSVGRDGLDDGGSETPPKRLGIQTRDVLFVVPDAAYRNKSSKSNR